MSSILRGGTLLGAYKNGGFIPWDDDVDLCVFEDDYDRAIKILMERLPGWMVVQCKETESKYFHGWIKIRDKNSRVLPDKDGYKYTGVWIDLYKVKEVSLKNVKWIIHKEHKNYLKRRYLSGGITKIEYRQRIKQNNLTRKIFTERIKSLFSSEKRKAYMIWSASKIIIDEDWVYPLKKIKFEDTFVWSLNEPDKYLAQHYGDDFVDNPPDELRRVGINKVVF